MTYKTYSRKVAKVLLQAVDYDSRSGKYTLTLRLTDAHGNEALRRLDVGDDLTIIHELNVSGVEFESMEVAAIDRLLKRCGFMAEDQCEVPVVSEEPLPVWALRRTTEGHNEVGAQLCTRDGRKSGNAVVVAALNDQRYILTDAGNMIVLTEREVEELFYPPLWVTDVNTSPGAVALRAAAEARERAKQ